MIQNFCYLLSKGKVGVERKEVMLIEKVLPSFELRIQTLCKTSKMEKVRQKAIGSSWILGPSPALFLCLHDTRVLMHLYTCN